VSKVTFDKKRELEKKGHKMVVELLYKEVMSVKVAETTEGQTHKQVRFFFFLLFSLRLI